MSSVLATLALALAMAAGGAADERIICVPTEDGKGWDCGRGAAAPAPRSLPRQQNRPAPSTPPPYLIDPSRLPTARDTVDAPAPPPPAPPAPRPEPAAAAEPVAAPEPAPMAAPEPSPAPAPAPDPELAPAPAPAPVSAPEPTPPPEPAAAPRPAAAPASAPVAEAPTASPPGAAPAGAEAFLALPPGHYTIQLAGAADVGSFVQQHAGRAGESYVVRVHRDGQDWWLLLWRDFPDLASARAAAATLGNGYWPRRLAPLQAEVRAAAAH